MNVRERQIFKAFGGRLVGKPLMKKVVCEIVAKFPDEIVEFVTDKVWFLSSMEDAWAFTFTGSDIQNHHLIFLSDELLNENLDQIYFTIAHEIGHVVMGHKNSILINQSKEEIRQQEREANAFARKYLS